MKKKDEVHAEDLLDQLKKHIDEPVILEEKPQEEEPPRPSTLEELFGHSFIRRNHSAGRAVTKAKPIPPEKKQDSAAQEDPTKARIDETQYDLRSIFGMKDQSEEKKNAKPAQKKKSKPADPYDHLTVEQKKALAAEYRQKLRWGRISLILLVILMGIALLWENVGFFGFKLPEFLDFEKYPATCGWLALQLMVFAALLVPEAFRREGKADRAGDPGQIFTVTLILHCGYLLFRVFFLQNEPMLTFSLPVLFCGALAKLCACGSLKREYLAFRIAFSTKEKYTLRLLEGKDAKLERDALRDAMPEGTRYFTVEKIRSVLGFQREIHTRGSVKRPIRLLIPASIFAGVCLGIIWWSRSGSFSQALSVGMGAVLLTMPLSLLYVFYAPLTALAQSAYQNNAAIIGERAMDEYAAPAVVTFQDSEVFPPEGVQLTSVKVFGNADLSKVVGYASAIFCATGGALGDMFSLVVSDTGYTADMDFITVSENGIEAAVDGEPVLVGSRAFFRDEGILLPPDSRDLETDDAVMYLAIAREAVARIEISYQMDEDFENIARNLFRSGVCVAIKTFDPNINRAFLEKRIRWGSDMPLKVVRGREKKDRILQRESAESLLLSSTKRGLFETVKYCRTTRNLMQIGVVLAGLSMLAAIPLYWLVLKMIGPAQVTSLNVLIYQLVWLVPMLIITKLFG